MVCSHPRKFGLDGKTEERVDEHAQNTDYTKTYEPQETCLKILLLKYPQS